MTYKWGGAVRMGRLMYCCNKRRFTRPDLHFTFYFMPGKVWVTWAFTGSPVGVASGRSGDLDTVGRYRGTRDSGEKGDGSYNMGQLTNSRHSDGVPDPDGAL